MKKTMLVCVCLVASALLSSVVFAQTTTKPKTKTGAGALFGGLLGAAAGGVIGHDSGKTTEGVLIGGAVGALGGAAVGSQMKSEVPVDDNGSASQPSSEGALTMKQIIYWSEQGLDADEIISRINKSGTVFMLTPDDVTYLQKRGVSQMVIEAMQGQ